MDQVSNERIFEHINYTDKKISPPIGIKRQIVLNPYSPSSYYDVQNNKLTFRFSSNNKDYLDPYSLFLRFTIDNLNAEVALKLDGSAHSIFREVQVLVDGKLIEHLKEYDVLMSNWNDMTKSNEDRAIAEGEGFGSSYDKNSLYKTDNPYCVGNCETVLFPQRTQFFGPYNVHDKSYRQAKGNEKIIGLYESSEGIPTFNGATRGTDFIIPIHSFFIGHGIPGYAYKYIPIFLMKNLEIVFTLNENAFFVPVYTADTIIGSGNLSNTAQMSTNVEKNMLFDVQDLYKSNPMEGGAYTGWKSLKDKITLLARNTYAQKTFWRLRNPQIIYDEIFINANVNSFQISTLEYGLLRADQFERNMMPSSFGNFAKKSNIYFINFCFLSNQYKQSGISRKLFKYSMNLKDYCLKFGNEIMPREKICGHAGNTIGEFNNLKIYNYYQHVYNKRSNKNAFNKYNISLNFGIWDLATSDQDYKLPVNLGDYHEFIGRALFPIDCETFPYAIEEYANGITTRDYNQAVELLVNTHVDSTGTTTFLDKNFQIFIFGLYDKHIKIDNTGEILATD